ncbi:uncharacterized protein ASCRUDRAFT_127426 [Ascoidea rubescens DSM 1968]|uniref:Condensation domain-containing protein n=1 Tax=Ascoidea rubescens DSM 1968 TaxID=1344418 RepID=A0A1D2VNK4_9ASCO|nr:hypothetical protein ASCRUDRAFT_127426 [Ascoidea rubescens DSM 1968]ODV63135.1 hypothetical protein ASCRUDRAFT_127426 [Ascoidea rubescens DSM 1968]
MEDIARRFTRSAGYAEQFWIAFNNIKAHKHLLINTTFNKPLPKELIITATRNILLKHSYLALRIVKDKDFDKRTKLEYILTPCSKIRISDVLNFEYDANYKTEIDEQYLLKLDRNYDFFQLYKKNKPFWKIEVLNDIHVSFICDHMLDGMSAVRFQIDLVNEVNKIKDTYTIGDLLENNSLFDFQKDYSLLAAIPKPIDEILDVIPSKSFREKFLINKLKPLKKYDSVDDKEGKINCFNFNKIFNTTDYPTVFKIIKFNHQENLKILSLCKTHNVKMNSFIHAAFISAISNYALDINEAPSTGEFAFPINLRAFMDEYKTDNDILYGCFVSLGFYGIERQVLYNNMNPFSWNLVKVINKKRSENIKNYMESVYEGMGMRKYLDSETDALERAINSRLGQLKTDSLRISNLGFNVVNNKNFGENNYKITNMLLSQNMGTLSTSLVLNIVSTENGMNILLGTIGGLFDKNVSKNQVKLDQVYERFRYILLNGTDLSNKNTGF